MSEIPKAYEPQAVEEKWYQYWLDQKCFVADPARVSDNRPAYSIVIPPPNVTGMLHMGHVLNNTIQDILSRKARMDGKEVLWLPGTDHAGIATQAVVEKALRKQGVMKHRDDLGREKFLAHVWTWKEKHGGIIIQQLKKLGCSCDWTRERFTMDPAYSRCVQKVFVELYKKGLIYRGKRMVNWCPVSQTALSDEEVIMEELFETLYYFRVELVEDPGTFLAIATTRPETIPGDTAVAVNPKDPRYAKYIGKHVIRPLPMETCFDQGIIPIIGDEHVDFKFGTGVLKVTPAHDKADFEIGQRHNLPVLDIMNPDATMNDLAGLDLRGLDRDEARKVAVGLLKNMQQFEREEFFTHNVGFSQRAGVKIESRLSEQWFLKYPSVEKATACVTGGARVPRADSGVTPESASPTSKSEERASGATPDAAAGTDALPPMRFHPERWSKTYAHWMTNLRDWCISRQLWWGHRVPVWYNRIGESARTKSCQLVEQAWEEISGKNVAQMRQAAFKLARERGILNNSFANLDTGWDIFVQQSSLEHAFSNRGLANIKLVPALPALIRQAVLLGSEAHEPPAPNIRAVHTFVAALRLGYRLFRVKFTVKELTSARKLYDHQTVEVKETEPDGKYPPEAQPLTGPLASRPASDSGTTVAELLSPVNNEKLIRCQIESPGPGWEQDPDVLDTWFSSWLWPFATMGWPEQTETLKKFYPTTDLVTGPDIIFFWVARMIMAGYEFMGDLPFRNVYFTGIIRDKLGRKMSKSLGNSPDPLELIAKYGADALRFGTMRSAPLGQDVLFDEKDVELGRNFCNKLWNACRFRQMQGGAVQGEIVPGLLTSDDKWILLRLDRAIRDISDAFAEYRFNEATQAIYRFFWSEFCDWHLEAAKAALNRLTSDTSLAPLGAERAEVRGALAGSVGTPAPPHPGPLPPAPRGGEGGALRGNTLAVLDFVLSHTLRLFHPFLPFITEELWHGLGYSADMPADQGGTTIMFAPWPKPLDQDFRDHYNLDDCYVEFAEARQELVIQGRNLRREKNIPANKRVRFILKCADPITPHDQAVLKLLLNAEVLDVDPDFLPPKGMPSARGKLGEIFLPLEGLIDDAAEGTRLAKELEKANAEIAKVQQKLDNPTFLQKAPPPVLQEHQKRLAEWQAKRGQIQKALEALGSRWVCA